MERNRKIDLMILRKIISNIIGWSTKRKFVIIESDDWGSIRTSCKKAYDAMLDSGLNVDKNYFTRFDSLESNEDLERLFNLLLEFKDSTGRPPVFTPMCLVANPDFDAIQLNNFREYQYQMLTQTITEYPAHDKLLDLWRSGAEDRLFVPALHGREHLNVRRFMKGIKDETNPGIRIGFYNRSIGASYYKSYPIPEHLGAFHPETPEEIIELKNIVKDACELFEEAVGYPPTHFIAPNKEGALEVDQALAEKNVKYLTLPKFRRYPVGNDKFKRQFNWWGKKNKFGQTLIMRNCAFEPSDPYVKNYADQCLKEIEIAFKWKKPAVISSHRVNYIGFIDQRNADSGLIQLKYLLEKIISKWPEVEFVTSTELGNLINNKTA